MMLPLILTAILGVAAGGPVKGFPEMVEQAVTLGDLETLRALRVEMVKESKRKDPPAIVRYDLAYVDWRICQMIGDAAKKERKKLLREAEVQLEAILRIDPIDAEALALLGSVVGEKIDGFVSGMFLTSRSNSSLKRAEAIEPKNPRIALQRGVALYFTPETFGGGLVEAEKSFRKAIALFAEEDPAKRWPNWGRVDSLAWLGLVLTLQGRYDEARGLFDRALELAPRHAWIHDELIPALEKAERSHPSTEGP